MPNWNDFQQKHILSPAESSECLLWNRVQWNTWLKKRLPNDFGRKHVNSIVFTTPDAVIKDFENLNYGVGASYLSYENLFLKFSSFTVQ